MGGMARVSVTATLVVLALLIASGCGGYSGIVPQALVSGWTVVMSDTSGNPQEAFTFDIFPEGSARTTARTVGACDATGLLVMSFTGWTGQLVTATIPLQANGTGTGAWTRAGAAPNSGVAVLTEMSPTVFSGHYSLSFDGDIAGATATEVTSDGVFVQSDLGTGVVHGGSALTAALTNGTTGGPLVLTGTLTSVGGAGGYRDHLGNTGVWALTMP
jgi:hypothetical protein